jgi:hypothetical protein
LSQDACRHTLPIFDGNHRYDLKLAFKRMLEPQLPQARSNGGDRGARWYSSRTTTLAYSEQIHCRDTVTAEKGYAGSVVVCSASYEPIAGHRPSTPLVKYLSEGREIEIALAPVAGTHLLAPFRVSVVSMLANLVIDANRFEATAHPPSTVADPKAQ